MSPHPPPPGRLPFLQLPLLLAALLALTSAPAAWLGAPVANLAYLAPLLIIYLLALHYLLPRETPASPEPHPLHTTALTLARFTAVATILLAATAALMWLLQPGLM